MKLHFCLSLFVLTTAILTAGSAGAATFSVSGGVGGTGIQSFSVNQFNTSLGTLNSVTILQYASGSAKLAFENTSTTPVNVAFSSSGSVNLLGAITVSPLGASFPAFFPTNYPFNQTSLSPYDGITDFSGNSGRTYQSQTLFANPVSALVNAASIGLFQGNGQVSLSAQLSGGGGVSVIPFGTFQGVSQSSTSLFANYTITYDYTPVPEPSTVVGMLISGAFGLTFYHKKRNKSLFNS
jgi:hypothetical protein